jgi:hypothetical protein
LTKSGSKTRPISAPAALLALIMYLPKPVLQACSILTVARRSGQTIAKLVFSVPEPLAMLPSLALVVLVPPRLRGDPRDLRNWNLNVGLPRRRTLGIPRRLRQCDGEDQRGDSSNANFHGCHSLCPLNELSIGSAAGNPLFRCRGVELIEPFAFGGHDAPLGRPPLPSQPPKPASAQ